MTVSIIDHLLNLTQSIIYWLRNTSYEKDGETKTLRQWLVDEGSIADLPVIVGFPDSLQHLSLPTLSLVRTLTPATSRRTYNDEINEILANYTLFGFAGGFPDDSRNQRQRDQLAWDIKQLMEDTETIDVFSVAVDGTLDTSVVVNTAEFMNVSERPIPVTGLTAGDRWRFAIDFSVSMIR